MTEGRFRDSILESQFRLSVCFSFDFHWMSFFRTDVTGEGGGFRHLPPKGASFLGLPEQTTAAPAETRYIGPIKKSQRAVKSEPEPQ